MLLRKLFLFLFLLALPTTAWAQLGSVPYSFSSGTVIRSAEVNANFSDVYSNALNRTGGTMTGTLTSQAIAPSADATYALGSASFAYTSAFLRTSLVLKQSTANYTIAWSNPASARALTIPDPGGDDSFVFLAATQTLTGKTLTNPTVNAGSGTLVLPQTTSPAQTAEGSVVWDSDDDLLTVGDGVSRKTLVGVTATQTLTNKTLTSPTLGGTVAGTYTLGGTPTFSVAIASSFFGLNTWSATGTGTTGLQVTNASAGTANIATVRVGNDTANVILAMRAFSSTFTTSGANIQAAGQLLSQSTVGLVYHTDQGSAYQAWYLANTLRMKLFPSGGLFLGATPSDPGAGAMTAEGKITAPSFVPNSSTVPTNGLYLPASNSLGLAVNSALALRVFATGGISVGDTTDPGAFGLRWVGQTQNPSVAVSITCDSSTVNNDVDIANATVVRLTTAGTGSCLVSGFNGGVSGRIVYFITPTNNVANAVNWDTETGSTSANQIKASAAGANYVSSSGEGAVFVYSATLSKWIMMRQR